MVDRLRRLDVLYTERVLGWKLGGLNDCTRPLHDPIPNDPDLRGDGGDPCADFTSKGGHRYLTQTTREGYTRCISLCGCDWNRDFWRVVDLPHYTRSLDAAWSGVDTIWSDKFRRKPLTFELNTIGDTIAAGWGTIDEWNLDGSPEPVGGADRGHPAEALVIACLRAVGCGEEELDATK